MSTPGDDPTIDGEYTPLPLAQRLRDAAATRGTRAVAGDFARWGIRLVAGLPHAGGEHGTFTLAGEDHAYCYGAYKRAWVTERAVEVPIAQQLVDETRAAGGRVLEVGHVLGHYRPGQDHVVVDKYESAEGVLNRDVMDLEPLGVFDLVIAVSTVEHVGWDEEPRVPGLAVEAITALRRSVAPGGRLVLTIPVGYNPSLDDAVRQGALPWSSLRALRREPGTTDWHEVDPTAALTAPYDFLLYSARAVLVAELPSRSSAS